MRAWVAAAALVAAFSMGSWVRAVDAGEAGILPWLAQPEAHSGAVVVVPLADVIAVQPHSYTIHKSGQDLRVEANPQGVEVGQSYTLSGTFHPERGVVVEQWRELHAYRPHKKVLGILGILVSLGLAAAAIHPSAAGLMVRDA